MNAFPRASIISGSNISIWISIREYFTVTAVIVFLFTWINPAFANNTEQLRNTYYFLDDYYSSNVANVPWVRSSSGLTDRGGQSWATSTFNFSPELPRHEIDGDGWYLYIVYFSETENTAIGFSHSGSAGGGFSNWSHGESNGIAEKEINNLWIQMMEGSCYSQGSHSGVCNSPGEFYTSQWRVRDVGCNNFCRQPIGIVFSKFDASDQIDNATTDQDIYNILERLILRNQQYTDSNITATTTWTATTSPYTISGNLTIEEGITLTIGPGVRVLFDTSTSSSLTVEGTLIAEGSLNGDGSISYVRFDADSPAPAPGDWGGIIIEPTGRAQLDYVVVGHGGASSTNNAQIYNNGGELLVDDSKIIYGTTYGIKNESGDADIMRTEIAYHDYGFYLASGAATVTPNNIIHKNSLYGIYNNSLTIIDATDNYWGDETGPYNNPNNLSGINNEVSSNIVFSPWTDELNFQNANSSVNGGEIKYLSVSTYNSELADAVSTWNSMATVTISSGIPNDLLISDINDADISWTGVWKYDPDPMDPDDIKLNRYYLDQVSTSSRQNTITHELGHALGLLHSFLGNVMFYQQTSQTTLGSQDIFDYDALY